MEVFRLIVVNIDEIRKTAVNNKNDLDECLTYFKLIFKFAQYQIIILWVA
jgi:hypothetical protein